MNASDATVKFAVGFDGWTPAFEVFPIVNSDNLVVGGFLVIEGPVWKCFVAKHGYPESLSLGDNDNPPWITPVRAADDSIVKLVVSSVKTSEESKKIHTTDGSDDE